MGAEILSSTEMRATEARAIARGDATGAGLMERAGQAVIDAVFARWPAMATAARRAVVLAGPGNNGGDGLVIARLLAGWGWAVEVLFYGAPEALGPDARANFDRWQGPRWLLGHPALTATDRNAITAALSTLGPHDLVVDALFGTGLTRGVDPLGALVGAVRAAAARVVAVDIPSGVCADSGRVLGQGPAIRADLTVTFHRAKIGHYLSHGPAHAGHLVVADIGLTETPSTAARLARVDPAALAKGGAGHKYGYGHAIVLGGPAGRSGAARLAARGALRVGAGLVTLASPQEAMAENAARLDAVMLRAVAGGESLHALINTARATALCLGPALGTDGAAAELVGGALDHVLRPDAPLIDVLDDRQIAAHRRKYGRRLAAVLDADALTVIAGAPPLMAALHGGTVLTPHGGEFARLFPDLVARLDAPASGGPAFSKLDATRQAAARTGAVVLFKGPDTVIAAPDGRAAISAAVYDRTAPWLATAGSGDVLAGMIAGLLARGLEPFDAAEQGAWLHVECARAFGPGLVAEDLPEMLPQVFAALGL